MALHNHPDNLLKRVCKTYIECIHIVIGEVYRQEYDLEYGSDCIEMHVGAVEPGEQALVVDDLVATGGTLCAAMNLLGTQICFLDMLIHIIHSIKSDFCLHKS